MNFHTSLPQGELARYHEQSSLSSLREPDATGRQWQRGAKAAMSLESVLQQLRFLQQQMNRMRKGHGGGDVQPASDLVVFTYASDLTDALQSDYIKAYKLRADGITDTSTVYKVAKPWRIRGSVYSETIGSVTYGYLYGGDYTTRVVSWTVGVTSYSEYQILVPPWVSGQKILAVKLPYTGVTDAISGQDVGWLDLNIHAMAWMRQST